MSSMISIRVLFGPRALARAEGIESEFLEAVGLDRAAWTDLDGWVPLRASRTAFEWLKTKTDDPAVGLRVADFVPPVAFDYLRFIGATSSSLGAAMKNLVLFLPMLNTGAQA